MRVVSDWIERLRALLFGRRADRELGEELQFHLEQEVAYRVSGGADPIAARRDALLALGGVGQVAEHVRDARGIRPFEELVADVRYAVRGLRATPAFTITVVLVLGLALGAATAVFAVADGVLISDLPYPHADRIIRVYNGAPSGNRWSLSMADALAIRDEQTSFESIGFRRSGDAVLTGAAGRRPQRVAIGSGTAGFFDVLGVAAELGRLVTPADEAAEAPAIAVVSQAFALEHFGAPAEALGKALSLDGTTRVIVGVLPKGVDELAGVRAGIWTQLKLSTPPRKGPFFLSGFGRLRPDRTIEAARRDTAGISQRMFPRWASSFQDKTARFLLVPLGESIRGDAAQPIGLFAGAVALVLLVALANVATLTIVRTSTRQQELAVRLALGASRARVARLLITDTLVLTAAAGAVALGLAALAVRLVVTLVPHMPRIHDVALNLPTVEFCLLGVLVSGGVIGLPAVVGGLSGRARKTLQLDTRRAGRDRRSQAIRSALVVIEFALAVPLLVGAGLLLQSLLHLQRVDPGFDPHGAVSVGIALPTSRYKTDDDVTTFWRRLEQRTIETPGITGAGLILNLPPDNPYDENNFRLLDRPPGGAEPTAPWSSVTTGYFSVLGIPLLEGRMLTSADSAAAPPVVLVSHAWARRYFPNESAVGKRMVSGGCATCPPTTVVGVVGDVKYLGLKGDADAVYEPSTQYISRSMHLVARTMAPEADALRSLRELVSALDPELATEEATMTARLGDTLAMPFRWTTVLGSFAAVAALLAALGVFGLMAYAVRQQRREIGIRLALGATPTSMTTLVVGRGLRHAGLGAMIGIGLTAFEGRWLTSFLFHASAGDPSMIAVVATGLLTIAALACWIPARQAAHIHPSEALSTE